MLGIFYNFHWVEPGQAARSSQAYAGFLGQFLRRRGIRTLINLRGDNPHFRWWRAETRLCQRLGILHRDVRLSSKHIPTRRMLLALLDAFDAAARPLLMKCSGGQDRTGLAAGLYLIHMRGREALAAAQDQLSSWPYLHWPRKNQLWLKQFLIFACEQSGARPLRTWLESEYVPENFAAWLSERGLSDAFAGIHHEIVPDK